MTIPSSHRFSVCCAIMLMTFGLSPLWCVDDTAAGVQLETVQVVRVGPNEVHLKVKIVNGSDKPVFGATIDREVLVPYPVYIEQWQPSRGWTIVAPCVDVPPPYVVRVDPGKAVSGDYRVKVPLGGACKQRDLKLQGRFRWRWEYFANERGAQAYSRGLETKGARVVVSEPFRIPAFDAKR